MKYSYYLLVMPTDAGYKIRDQYGTYFTTLTVVGWVDLFTRKECKDIIFQTFKYCKRYKGLIIHAFVIMPSHIHLIVIAEEERVHFILTLSKAKGQRHFIRTLYNLGV